LHLLWRDRRHEIRDPALVLAALTWTAQRPVDLAPALLNAVPVGADLARVPIPDRGGGSVAVDGARIGEVFVVESQGGRRQYAAARRDGLADITELQADLLLTDLGQDEPTPLSQTRFAAVRKVGALVPTGPGAPPAAAPDLVAVERGAVCGRIGDDSGAAQVQIGTTLPDLIGAPHSAGRSGRGGVLADHVLVRSGRAVVVEAVPAPGAAGGTVCVVTDRGLRHPVADREVLRLLGYADVAPVRLPASLVGLVPPAGPLDRRAALDPLPSG
jgi:hypothetical protein